jgi:predicted aldo/keto reductase-like oxidoreductase
MHMKTRYTRRQFLERSAAAAAALLVPGRLLSQVVPAKRTATDQVTLGFTGIRLSRLGIGTGSNGGQVQEELGKEEFCSLIRYAYDQGITYIDCAQNYRTFHWIADAIKGLPREKLFIQSKIWGMHDDYMKVIDEHRKILNTDYVDSMLIHAMRQDHWTAIFKQEMDKFDEAKQKKWIRAKGVSCHSLAALRGAAESPWTEVHLVRVNPQGRCVDGESANNDMGINPVEPTLGQLKIMKGKGRGVIGMKMVGNGRFVDAADREKAIRFAMSRPELDAVVIGFKNRAEIDEAIRRMNAALV